MSALPDHALLKLVERIVTPARANLLPSPYNCAHCGKEGSASEETLKECGRCNMLRYCDKTCQTAAWPSHRETCKPNSPLVKQVTTVGFGGRSVPFVMEGLYQWVARTHYTDFTVIVNAMLRALEEPIDVTLASQNFIRLEISARKNDRGRATRDSFRYGHAYLCPQSHFQVYNWTDNLLEKTRTEEDFKRSIPAELRSRFAGLMYAVVTLDHTELHVMAYFPVFRLRDGRNQGAVKTPEMNDLVTMMTAIVNEKCSIDGESNEAGLLGPVPEVCSKEPTEELWYPVSGSVRERLFGGLSARQRSRLSFEDLFKVYQRM